MMVLNKTNILFTHAKYLDEWNMPLCDMMYKQLICLC
jgi:hypothetical protein